MVFTHGHPTATEPLLERWFLLVLFVIFQTQAYFRKFHSESVKIETVPQVRTLVTKADT